MSDAATVLTRQCAEADLAYAQKELERAVAAAMLQHERLVRAIAFADQWARAMREQQDRLERLR